MTSKFSGAVMIGDLDDYIAPSQTCIKPVVVERKDGASKLVLEDDGSYAEVDEYGTKHALKAASITLNDCLACSGCVTSAETVLIQQQSTDEFLKRLGDASVLLRVVSLSPQSRASLAAHFGISTKEVMERLTTVFHQLGVNYLFDTTFSRDISLLEIADEFVRKYREQQASASKKTLPLLTSACPGWVCYAEKKHGSYVLPFVSSSRSPQQVMGVLVKRFLAQKHGYPASAVYHASVMPCFDKKLEASRPDFADAGSGARDVDTVLTSGEILELLSLRGIDLMTVPPSPLDTLLSGVTSEQELYGHQGGGSGGYLYHVFMHAAKELFGVSAPEFQLTRVRERSEDLQTAVLRIGDQEVLRFALAYGFKNIQNIVRQIKMGKSQYHFVEIMACPSGCLNGGGQIKPPKGISASNWLARVRALYEQTVVVPPEATAAYAAFRTKRAAEDVPSRDETDPMDTSEALLRNMRLKLEDAAPGGSLWHTVYHEVTGASLQW